MAGRFSEEIAARLGRTEEIEIETRSAAGVVHRTTIWVVVEGGEVFVRSVTGAGARWYREISANPSAAVHVGGDRIPVTAVPATEAASVGRASAEYLRKYASSEYAPAMVVEGVLGTTLRLEPAGG